MRHAPAAEPIDLRAHRRARDPGRPSSPRPTASSRSRTSRPRRPCTCSWCPRPSAYRDVVELAAGDPALLAEVVATAHAHRRRARGRRVPARLQHRRAAGQTVFHVHAHVLAGDGSEGSLAELTTPRPDRRREDRRRATSPSTASPWCGCSARRTACCDRRAAVPRRRRARPRQRGHPRRDPSATSPRPARSSTSSSRWCATDTTSARPRSRRRRASSTRTTAARPTCSGSHRRRPGARASGRRPSGQKQYVDAIDEQHDRVRHRPRRHGQDLPRHGQGRPGAAAQERSSASS